MLALVAIGQQLSILKQNKSIKVYLDIFLTPTFVYSQLKDYNIGNIFLKERLDYENLSDHSLLLSKVEEVLNIINIDLYDVVEPKLILDNNNYILVPESLYKKGKEKTYLKFNTNFESNDYIEVDNLQKLSVFNVYLPCVIINNYLIDKFKKLEFYHFNTVLINKIVNSNNPSSCYCFIESRVLKILILKKNEILFFNSYEYKTIDDILYYLLLALNDKNLKRETLSVSIYTNKKNEGIKSKFGNFIKNISIFKYDNIIELH